MNIIDLTLFKINIVASPFLLLNYVVGKKYRCGTTKPKLYQSPIALKGFRSSTWTFKKPLLNKGTIK